jgi:hypothetical protein
MKNVLKVSIVALSALALFAVAAPTHAYFYQSQTPAYRQYAPQYPTYNYQPYQFFNYSGNNELSGLIQGHLNFIQQYQYIPAPVHQYFYQYYTPSYYGYGY